MTTVLTPATTAERPAATLAVKVVAVAAAVATGLRIDLFKGITPGVLLMVVLVPVWWPLLRTSRVVQVLVGLTALALVWGTVLAWLVKDQRAVDPRLATSSASFAALAGAGLVVLLWVRTVVSTSATVVAFVAGYVLYLGTTRGLWASNPWKLAFAQPVSVLVLVAVAWAATRRGRERPVLTVVALLLLAGVSLVSDYRSQAGFLVLTALLSVWQTVAVGTRRRLKAASPLLLIGTLAVAVYLVATQLFVSGALGAEIQQRSAEQLDASGSLLLGGRPEWSATVQLMSAHPGGYGLGVVADSRDVQLAENGFASINVDPATGYEAYITNYMLADGFRLHSVAADLWASTGPAGIALAVAVLVIVMWSLSASLAVGRASPLLVYSAITVLWDIAFSPLFSSLSEVLLGVFVAVVSLQHARAVRAERPAPSPEADRRDVASTAAPGRVLYGAAAASSDRNGGPRGLL